MWVTQGQERETIGIKKKLLEEKTFGSSFIQEGGKRREGTEEWTIDYSSLILIQHKLDNNYGLKLAALCYLWIYVNSNKYIE